MTSGEARLADALARARHVVALTGSGVSADSGIPTFRDVQSGLWARYRPEDLATPAAFERDPLLVWQWYMWRRRLIDDARPNPAHMALAGMQQLLHLTLVTQNVDGLHQRAGSRDVIEFHGNIHRSRCCAENRLVDVPTSELRKAPRCPACRALLRPDVVWFGEPIPAGALVAASLAADDCDVFIAIGTSGVVQPAAGLAARAHAGGAFLAEINPAPTAVSPAVDVAIRDGASESLPRLLSALGARERGYGHGPPR